MSDAFVDLLLIIINGGCVDIVVVRGSYTMFLSIYCVSEVKSHTPIV
jgi:hypothetical protein